MLDSIVYGPRRSSVSPGTTRRWTERTTARRGSRPNTELASRCLERRRCRRSCRCAVSSYVSMVRTTAPLMLIRGAVHVLRRIDHVGECALRRPTGLGSGFTPCRSRSSGYRRLRQRRRWRSKECRKKPYYACAGHFSSWRLTEQAGTIWMRASLLALWLLEFHAAATTVSRRVRSLCFFE